MLETFFAGTPSLPLDDSAAARAAQLRDTLVRANQAIGEFDLLIAAIALQANLTTVTSNTRAFARVPGLRIEGWMA